MNDSNKNKLLSSVESLPFIYIMIQNIPLNFHTPDLRNFFSYSIEKESFVCFYYRHRPNASDDKSNICMCKIKSSKFDEFVKLYDKKNWIDSKGNLYASKCSIVKIKILNKENQDDKNKKDKNVLTQNDVNNLLEFRNIPTWMPNGNVGTPTKVFIDYINQCIMPQSLIAKLGLNLKAFKKHKKKKYSNVEYKYDVVENEDDGYYEEYELSNTDDNADTYQHIDVATTANGDQINDNIYDEVEIKELNYFKSQQKKKNLEKDEQNVEQDNKNNKEKDDDDDGDDLEDWERHEALHDDVTKQDRTSPYFFEKEIELQWEKGGSGLVFYTDVNFWNEHEDKDFDAETADDWDLDMSAYYEENGGDKDARDLIQMSREEMLKKGIDLKLTEPDKFRKSAFNCFNKPKLITMSQSKYKSNSETSKNLLKEDFGRRHLEKLGWKEGEPIGNPVRMGLKKALDGSDGKLPRDKTGIGYHGEKIDKEKLISEQKLKRERERRLAPYYIASKYDKDIDLGTNPLRRIEPSMKYRSTDAS